MCIRDRDNALCIVNGDNKMLEAWAITKERDLSVWFVASEQNTGRLERDGFPAVSYTHLDVYKRQVVSRAEQDGRTVYEAPAELGPKVFSEETTSRIRKLLGATGRSTLYYTCLLYTSDMMET